MPPHCCCSRTYGAIRRTFVNFYSDFLNHNNNDTFNVKINAFLAFLNKPEQVFTFTNLLREQVVDMYKIVADKVEVVMPGIEKKYQPICWKEKELIKEKFSTCKEYFLYTGCIRPAANLTNLLKAFSLFKKRQKTNMQLVLASEEAIVDKPFIKSLESYKFRTDVILLTNVKKQDLIQLTTAAYALLDISYLNHGWFHLPAAMQAAVPVIANDTIENKSLLSDAASYVSGDDIESIAKAMMLLFTNETARNKFVENGLRQSKQFDGEKSIFLLWEKISTLVK